MVVSDKPPESTLRTVGAGSEIHAGNVIDTDKRPSSIDGLESYSVMSIGLTKIFRRGERDEGLVAVRDVSFACSKGEVFGLLGPNGAGKTTTLRMLSTVLRPTIGTARVAGSDVRRAPQHVRASIGFLSGNTRLYPRLSVRETLEFFGRLHGFEGSELDGRVAHVIEALDMHDFADRRLERLSTGMAQKANIGRTLLHDPPVLILDEPTSGLDVLGAAAMIDFVAEMRQRGKTVIFSTHILTEAERLCDRIGILNNGRLHAVGSLDELRMRTEKEFLDEIFLSLVREDDASGGSDR